MFKKAISVHSQNKLSGKDAKKLKADLQKAFPALTDEKMKEVLPGKDDILLSKLSNKALMYSKEGGPPMFFDADGRGDLYPTVYALWRLPDMLPGITTHPQVSQYVLGGADLMLPGVIADDRLSGTFTAGQKRCIFVRDNSMPIAVGEMVAGSADIKKNGLKGKGLKVVHFYRDSLWELGGKLTPNDGFKEQYVLPEAGHGDLDGDYTEVAEPAEGDGGQSPSTAAQGPSVGGQSPSTAAQGPSVAGELHEDEEDPELAAAAQLEKTSLQTGEPSGDKTEPSSAETVEDMDSLLESAFLTALKVRISEDDLPMDTSAFYSNHVLACRPPGTSIDIKKSSWKKLSKFLDAMEKKRLIATKEQRSLSNLVHVNFQHPLLVKFVPRYVPHEEHVEKDAGGQAPESQKAPIITELYSPTAHMKPIFQASELGSSAQHFTLKEARQVIKEYIEKEQLRDAKDPALVVLDPLLCDALYKGDKIASSDIPTHCTIEEIMSRLPHRLQQFYAITFEGSSEKPVIKKGQVKNIQIVSETRGGRKYVTRVSGLEIFNIDPEQLAHDLQRLFACSTSVAELPGKNNTNQEVHVQGHVIKELGEYLTSHYKIPKKYIEVMDKTKPK